MIETKRLVLRKIKHEDVAELKKILQDERVMYAWEQAFSDEEVEEWVNKNLERYEEDGFSYYAAIEKSSGQLIGVMGPLVERVHGIAYIGVAYILNYDNWRQGFATEGVEACVHYAFEQLGAEEVIAQIRPTNTQSIEVAKRLGMKHVGSFVKVYKEKEMEHHLYCITHEDAGKRKK